MKFKVGKILRVKSREELRKNGLQFAFINLFAGKIIKIIDFEIMFDNDFRIRGSDVNDGNWKFVTYGKEIEKFDPFIDDNEIKLKNSLFEL